MIKFMLEDPGFYTFEFFFNIIMQNVLVSYPDFLRTFHFLE